MAACPTLAHHERPVHTRWTFVDHDRETPPVWWRGRYRRREFLVKPATKPSSAELNSDNSGGRHIVKSYSSFPSQRD